ncbi:L,D-transpeptidase [Methylobacterium durans]|uniref:Murein L,D-transpeptidase n=1 Tax=Methylobacterium durans TaxID=2202825 RepID=A0A2U8W1A6_9HYPH|nr:L,D-transpeptidase [Methylobacterium durans]AWN39428.1 murein L,D-transpeptidase [Methylobacterium durans]
MSGRFALRACVALVGTLCLSAPGLAAPKREPPTLNRDAVNAAAPEAKDKDAKPQKKVARKESRKDDDPDPLTVKAQVLLDRARFSPGAIDGRDGDNYQGALDAFAKAQGLSETKSLTPELFEKLQAAGSDPVITEYTITEDDVRGPFVEKIPAKMEEQAELDAMSYTNPREMLAERFHMSRDLLSALNPDAAFDKAGTVIAVAAVPPLGRGKVKAKDLPQAPKVSRIEIDKASRDLRAFDKDGKLLAYYPASIGSEEKPAPSGEAKVKGVAFEPAYTYNPKYQFAGVKSKEKFSIHPGPNNPVGVVWIDLSIPSYGIHGTPDPEKVGKTESHGCIRLTNWDARDLALHVERGATVSFKEE